MFAVIDFSEGLYVYQMMMPANEPSSIVERSRKDGMEELLQLKNDQLQVAFSPHDKDITEKKSDIMQRILDRQHGLPEDNQQQKPTKSNPADPEELVTEQSMITDLQETLKLSKRTMDVLATEQFVTVADLKLLDDQDMNRWKLPLRDILSIRGFLKQFPSSFQMPNLQSLNRVQRYSTSHKIMNGRVHQSPANQLNGKLRIDSTIDTVTEGRHTMSQKYPTPLQKTEFSSTQFQPHQNNACWSSFDEIVTINVGGRHYQTLNSTLNRFPHSLLGNPVRRAKFYRPETNEHFFDRNRYCFEPILEVYLTGKPLNRPSNIPIETFMIELLFYDLGLEVAEDLLRREDLLKPEIILPQTRIKRIIFNLFECPDSGYFAHAIAFFNIVITLLSITSFCAQTMPQFQNHISVIFNTSDIVEYNEYNEISSDNPFFLIESICTAWFTIDLVTRFVVSPNKLHFFHVPFNIVDFLSIVPYYFSLIIELSPANGDAKVLFLTTLRVLRIIKLFRVFKLGRYSTGLQIYGLTLHAARYEIFLMIMVACIGTVVCSSSIYFAEQSVANTTQFTSIPAGFWFAIVTWTTVGYGDMIPLSVVGKFFGACCAICGILALSFTVPVVVAHFQHFFFRTRDMERLKDVFKELERMKKSKLEEAVVNHRKQLVLLQSQLGLKKEEMWATVNADASQPETPSGYIAKTH